MHSDYYAHPEFGFLSPTPRLRRELRTAFFSVLFGIGIGAAAMIALSGNNSSDDAPLHTSKPDGSTPEANSENHKTNATTTCDVNNSACLNVPSAAGKPRGMPMPAANDALAIGRAPLGRPDASAGMTKFCASKAALCATGRARTAANTNAVHDRLLQSMRVRFSDSEHGVHHASAHPANGVPPSTAPPSTTGTNWRLARCGNNRPPAPLPRALGRLSRA